MIKKIFMLSLTFVLTIVQVQAHTQNGLKAAFDELTYALNVEWDQEDQAFKQSQIKKFQAQIELLKSQGLTEEELLEEALSQVKNEHDRKQIKAAFTLIQINKLDKREAHEFLKETLSKTHSEGASWSGGVKEGILIAVFFSVALAAFLLMPSGSDGEPRPLGQQEDGSFCGYSEVCGYEYDFFSDEEVYACRQEYHCVSI